MKVDVPHSDQFSRKPNVGQLDGDVLKETFPSSLELSLIV